MGAICTDIKKVKRELTNYFTKEIADKLIKDGWRKVKWISVKKRLPDRNGEYLTINRKSSVGYDLCHWNGYFKTFTLSGTTGDKHLRHPTHWMPLPEPPDKD